ncbi:MAG: hypothetical protein NZ920_04095 [Aigarchaeota archaeon]|nr:hypothetical protein [Aigarchaeota archaeon]MDW8092197.1 hypothetical protein [Nitrososphaerota archaeon]
MIITSIRRTSRQNLSKVLTTMLVPSRYTIERWSYTLQRVSGVVVMLYFVAHVIETGYVVGGPGVWYVPPYEVAQRSWETVKASLKDPVFDVGLGIIGLLVTFHTINGVRLTLTHFGYTLKRPHRPEFPYEVRSFTNFQRGLFWLSISFAVFSMIYALDTLLGVFRA